MKRLFKESTTQIFSKIKKSFLWTAVCLLIGGFAIGAILILANAMSAEMGKLLATMATLTLVLFVGVNNFTRMEKGDLTVQICALVGLISGIIASVLGILLIWEIIPYYDSTNCFYSFYCSSQLSAASKFLSILVSLAAAGFWISNVLSIKETIKVIKPLKITSVICEVYCTIFAIVVSFASMSNIPTNMYTLSGLASFAFVATALAALIISKSNKTEKAISPAVSATSPTTSSVSAVKSSNSTTHKTDDEIRAEVEEQVRREMIEKEVRAKMKAELDSQKKKD